MTELNEQIVYGSGLSDSLTPDQLAELAVSRPDLWEQIEQHPNTHPDLRQWIFARRAEQWHFDTVDDEDTHAYEDETAPKKPRAAAILAVLLIALLALGGTGAALSATGSWPFGPERVVTPDTPREFS